jgi:hypothetical protein
MHQIIFQLQTFEMRPRTDVAVPKLYICQGINVRNLTIKVHHGALSIANDTSLFFTNKQRIVAVTNASNYILATNGSDAEMILPKLNFTFAKESML